MKPNDPITGCIHGSSLDPKCKGLTVRQWFVGKALGSFPSNLIPVGSDIKPEEVMKLVVERAFTIADLAIKQLEDDATMAGVEPEVPLPAPITPDMM